MENVMKNGQGLGRKGRGLRIAVIAVLIVCLLAGTALSVFLGVHYIDFFSREDNARRFLPLLIVVYLAAFAGAEYIGITLLVMVLSLGTDPFVKQNVVRLRAMGFVALGIQTAILLLLLMPYNSLLFQAAGLGIGLCGLLSLVMAELFDRAVAYKQENDLTV